MVVTKAAGVIERSSSSNIKEYPSIVGRSNGTAALTSAKVVSSFIGKWALMKKLKTQVGIKDMMNFKIEDEETAFPIVESTMARDSSPPLSAESMSSLFLSEEHISPYKSISDYYEVYKNETSTPLAVIERLIEFYSSDEAKTLNAIFEFHEDEMREAAKVSERMWKDKTPRSILEGVPFVVKEEIFISGYRCVRGLGRIAVSPKTETHPIVQRLLDAGAILVGTTRMTQLSCGAIGVNPAEAYGTVRNPCNPAFYTGGSGSGTAAAVSAGFVPFGLAVDGLGSGRIPAALSGIVGFKPTFARVANFGKHLELPFFVIGPMANNVRDAAIVYGFISGASSSYKYGLNQPAVELPALNEEFKLKTVRFGHDESFTKASYNDAITGAILGVVSELKNKGCDVQNYCIPELQETLGATCACLMKQNQITSMETYGEGVEGMINCVNATILYSLGKCIDEKEVEQSRRQRTRSILIAKSMFDEFDVFVSPSTAAFAQKIEPGDEKYGVLDDISSSRMIRYSALGSLTGIPSIVINIGTTEDNLPKSVQLSAAWWNEKLLLDVAYKLEKIYSDDKRSPKIFKSII